MIFVVGTWCPSLAEPGEWMVGVMSQVPTPGTGHSSITWSELSRAEVLPLLTPDPWPRIGEKYLSVTQSGWVPSGGGQLDPVVLKLETHKITAKVRHFDLQICNLQNYFIQTNFVFETGDSVIMTVSMSLVISAAIEEYFYLEKFMKSLQQSELGWGGVFWNIFCCWPGATLWPDTLLSTLVSVICFQIQILQFSEKQLSVEIV